MNIIPHYWKTIILKCKALLIINAITNFTIAVEDTDISEKIFEPDVRSLKIKITRTKPNPIRKYYIEFPKGLIQHLHNFELSIDI